MCALLAALVLILEGCTAPKPSAPAHRRRRPPSAAQIKNPVRPPLRIVIDPGHGGESTGAVGIGRVLEKEVTLKISLELADLIRRRMSHEVILTRTTDKSLALTERTELANDQQGTIFLSIHANASETHRRHGIEVYYLDNTADEGSLKLAERENGRPLTEEEQDLSFIVSDVIQTAKMEESITMGHYVYDSLLQRLRKTYPGVRGNGVMKAPFSVLVGAHMPAILVEVSYIDERTEGARLLTAEYQRAIAEGLFAGVKRFLEKALPNG